jgi:hypothetical protein
MSNSVYDEIFDKYFDKKYTKAGTKYEVLAAMVVKHLIDSGKVIHDLKLLGQSDIKHQIDVVVEDEGSKKRILIECKDFDISENLVGLEIIRNFSAVVEDVKPDESFIFTCNNYTKDAIKFAKFKNIKLSILRNFTEIDGRIKKIILHFNFLSLSTPKAEIVINEEHHYKLSNDLSKEELNPTVLSKHQQLFLNTPSGRYQLNEYVEQVIRKYPIEKEGPVQLKHKLDSCTLEVANRGGLPILGLIIDFEVFQNTEIQEIVSDKIAELIISGFAENDIIIFDQDILKYDIDSDTGEIHLK